jgi:hypothetical protein
MDIVACVRLFQEPELLLPGASAQSFLIFLDTLLSQTVFCAEFYSTFGKEKTIYRVTQSHVGNSVVVTL